MFCKTGRALAVATGLAALIWCSGCARRAPGPYFQRLAVLRFENLGADPSVDWIGRALSEMLTSELAGAPAIYALPSSRIHAYERVLGARPVGAPAYRPNAVWRWPPGQTAWRTANTRSDPAKSWSA